MASFLPIMFRMLRTALIVAVSWCALGSLSHGALVGVSNWYHLELWRFPDPAQDMSSL